MIISHIIGGIGNQMFQYALGRSRSLARGTDLRLDVSDFAGYGLHHGFQLSEVFAGTFLQASKQDVYALLGWRGYRPCRRLLVRHGASAFRGHRLVVEPHFDYWPSVAEAGSESYFVGYWQSEKYFQNCEAVIRSDFAFRRPLVGLNLEWVSRISKSTAVSLHVRRGDYATNPKTLAVHGLCSAEYYRSAVELIARAVGSPEFYIFSDDIPWVRQHLNIDYPCHYVENNLAADSYCDMHLMSLCRHHIIANSSFGWWGAWLNSKGGKMVIAPRRWFSNGLECADLIPEGWARL